MTGNLLLPKIHRDTLFILQLFPCPDWFDLYISIKRQRFLKTRLNCPAVSTKPIPSSHKQIIVHFLAAATINDMRKFIRNFFTL
jgi:hypothetical protein